MKVTKRDGRIVELDANKITVAVERAAKDYPAVSVSDIILSAKFNFYENIPTSEIDRAVIFAAREKAPYHPHYAYVAASLRLNGIYKEVFGVGVEESVFEEQYRMAFVKSLKRLVAEKFLHPELLTKFDLKKLKAALKPENDSLYRILAIDIIHGRYLAKDKKGNALESPQAWLMRVAMGLSLNEKNPTEAAIAFYNAMSNLEYLPSTPTLFNSGTTHSQLSSCYLSTFDDSINGIYEGIADQARLSKYAGGLAISLTRLRGKNAYINGTRGTSNGIVPWAVSINAMTIAVNQGGKRQGSAVIYLEPWHIDYRDFLNLRDVTGDDRQRAHDTNTAVFINDLFMKKVFNQESWAMFSPDTTNDLPSKYGKEFNAEYEKHVKSLPDDEKVIEPAFLTGQDSIYKTTIKKLMATGHPWMVYKDSINMRYTLQGLGVVQSSNLCTEITEHTVPTTYAEKGAVDKLGETAVCNLASIDLSRMVKYGLLDLELLRKTVRLAVRGLDNVIDLNFNPTEAAENSSKQHRFVGLGQMGEKDMLYKLGLTPGTIEAVKFEYVVTELINFWAYEMSAELARERGSFPTFEHSTWFQGKLPHDLYLEFRKYRKDMFKEDFMVAHEEVIKEQKGKKFVPNLKELAKEYGHKLASSLIPGPEDFNRLRDLVAGGMRNALVRAIAPTATISYLAGCSQSIEPYKSVIYGIDAINKGLILNESFYKDLEDLGLLTYEIADKIVAEDGELDNIAEIPQWVKDRYRGYFDMDPRIMTLATALKQIGIDQAISFNMYMKTPTTSKVIKMYEDTFKLGLKSTYYLRTTNGNKIAKNDGVILEPVACSITNPDCEACQ